MQIRDLQESDVPVLLGMVQALSAFHNDVAATTTQDLIRDCFGPDALVHVLIAEHQSDVLGYAALVRRVTFHAGVRNVDVHHLFVTEAARSQGVGRALLDAAAKWAKLRGCSKLLIGTDPENHAAQEMYLRYGFERIDDIYPSFRLPLETNEAV